MKGFQLPTRNLVSQADTAIIEQPQVPRSTFHGSWTRKTTFDAGYIVPFLVDEILPGDHMTYNVTAYVRMATPLFPMFDNQRIDTFFFFVPNRLVWDNFVRMMGEQNNPSDSIAYTVPSLTVTAQPIGSIYDHFGLPTLEGQMVEDGGCEVNTLPLRGYNLVYNTWFKDENLQDNITVRKTDGGDLIADFELRQRAKAHDYFTSALPWAQKFTAPTVPIGGIAPIIGLGALTTDANAGPVAPWETDAGAPTSYTYYKELFGASSAGSNMVAKMSGNPGTPQIYADLAEATGSSINTLRQAWMVQSLLERDARGGTRYVELIRSHFGVTNPDFRLQRPEYIGGGQTPLQLTPIAQTAPTAGVPLGALGAAGTAAGTHRASYAATEHGYILGLINVRSELSYQQGLHKMWKRRTRFDFYWPAFAGLGEQVISRDEIFANGNTTQDAEAFGYQERWQEYRTRYSEVTGMMRSFADGTLDAWHLAQYFADAPVLGGTFIKDTPPMERILAAGELAANQQYLADIMIQRTAVRPIPMFGTPVTLGRF